MSSRNQSGKRTPRAMPVETIITRFKSAQQKKLQEPETKKVIKKNKTTKKSLPPETEKKTKFQEIKQLIENNEFYPNRHKRNVKPKKIVLIPKTRLKMVGGTKSNNKRKLHIPRKETNHTLSQVLTGIENNSNLSFPDLIRDIEESGSLDDEDFLEILTCPSPVWWEDPPHGYMEEPLYSRSPEENRSKTQCEDKAENINYSIAKNLVINVEDRSKNFIKKRGKLENLLKNMREKVHKPENKQENNNSDRNNEESLELRDDDLTHLENIDIPIEKDKISDEDIDKNMAIDEEYLDMSYFEDYYDKDIEVDKSEAKTEAKQERYFKQIQNDQDEYVAVYKIIESDDDIDTSEVIKNKQINSYYKHKKFKSKIDKCRCYKNKSIKVSESVKYCMVCSSINDTDECKYCMGKCVCDKYTCDVCTIQVGSKNDLISHIKQHTDEIK